MSLEKTADNIVRIMSGVDMTYVINSREKEHLNLMIGMVVTDLNNLGTEDEVERTEEDLHIMRRAMTIGKRLILEVPITERIREIVKDVCLLAHNWNVNVGNDAELHKDIKFINVAIDQHFTIVQAIEVLKRVLDRAETVYVDNENINSISTHYLQVLDKINKKDKTCEEDRCI
jgi:hypothetical protein